MKGVFLSLVVLFSVRATAQTLTLPSCGVTCVDSLTSGNSIDGCSVTDTTCLCSNQELIQGIECCLAASCDAADQAASISYYQSICRTNGVTLPSALTCSSSTSSAASSTRIASSASSSSATVATSSSPSSISSFSSSTPGPTSSTTSTSSASSTSASSIHESTTSSSPSSTSSVSPLPTTSNNGLSTGAKAGIAIGAIIAVLLALLLIFFLLKRRKSARSAQTEDQLPIESELPTKSNTHEIDGRNTRHELPAKDEKRGDFNLIPSPGVEPYNAAMPELSADKPRFSVQRKELHAPVNDHEMESSLQQRGELQSESPVPQQTTFSQPFRPGLEVVEQSVGSGGGLKSPREEAPSRLSGQTVFSDSETTGSSSRMEELRAKREKIRVEKERLLKLQELDEMEAAVQREMLEEQMRQGRDGNG